VTILDNIRRALEAHEDFAAEGTDIKGAQQIRVEGHDIAAICETLLEVSKGMRSKRKDCEMLRNERVILRNAKRPVDAEIIITMY
jgi:hypothetical protein